MDRDGKYTLQRAVLGQDMEKAGNHHNTAMELGLLPELGMGQVNELFIQTQPAHLQKISGTELDTADRNVARATFLRRHLNREDINGSPEAN